MAFADALGTGTYLAGAVVFFTKALGLTAAQVGLGLSLGAVVGIATTFPIGALADRFGPRRVMIAHGPEHQDILRGHEKNDDDDTESHLEMSKPAKCGLPPAREDGRANDE